MNKIFLYKSANKYRVQACKNYNANISFTVAEKAFEEVQKTVEELREQNEELKKEHQRLRDELDLSREKYYHQIEINAATSAQLTKLNFDIGGVDKRD